MKYGTNKQLSLFKEAEIEKMLSDEDTNCDEQYFKSLSPLKVTPVYDLYWKFAKSRQDVFFRKLNKKVPLTKDPVFKKYKFTNTYRASDRVSQYLIKNVIYGKKYTSLNTFFRIILFKLFNKVETWELLEREFGEITYENYNYNKYNEFLSSLMDSKRRIYSAAYIMAPGRLKPNLNRKHSNHLKLLEMMIADNAHEKIKESNDFQSVFDLLINYPMIGDFLGYQFAIDLNYSELINYSENDFVIPGPGALNGIAKCFLKTGGLSNIEIIKFMKDRQEFEFNRLGLDFQSLWGRALTLIDCQNIFCEVDKYSRVAFPNIKGKNDRKKIKQKYKPHSKRMNSYMYPPKWGINDTIKSQAK